MPDVKVTGYKKPIDSERFEDVMEALYLLMKMDDPYIMNALDSLPLCALERLEAGGPRHTLEEALEPRDDKEKSMALTITLDLLKTIPAMFSEPLQTTIDGNLICDRIFDETGRMHEDAAAIIRATGLQVPPKLMEYGKEGEWSDFIRENRTRIPFNNPLDLTDPPTIRYDRGQHSRPETWRLLNLPAKGEEQMGC